MSPFTRIDGDLYMPGPMSDCSSDDLPDRINAVANELLRALEEKGLKEADLDIRERFAVRQRLHDATVGFEERLVAKGLRAQILFCLHYAALEGTADEVDRMVEGLRDDLDTSDGVVW